MGGATEAEGNAVANLQRLAKRCQEYSDKGTWMPTKYLLSGDVV